jgi:hypothetical protein
LSAYTDNEFLTGFGIKALNSTQCAPQCVDEAANIVKTNGMTSLKQNTLIVLVSSVISLAFAELAIRIALPPPGFIPLRVPAGMIIPHETRHFTYGPAFEGIAGKYHPHSEKISISINDLGLRDDPVLAETEVDILAIGDSYTAGWGVEASDSWSSQLEQQLNSGLAIADKLTIVNAGIPGYGLTQMRLFLEELLTLQPKFVVIGLYTLGGWPDKQPICLPWRDYHQKKQGQ